MTNEEFYYKLVEYQRMGLVFCSPKTKNVNGYLPYKIGRRLLFISKSIEDFFFEVENKYDQKQLFSQHEIECYYGRTHSFIQGLTNKSEILKFESGGVCLYVLKNE